MAIFKPGADRIAVDTLLLSCRALGRGVEHRMLARLGAIAAERGLSHVQIPFKQTDRNQPALDFLTSVGARFRQSNGDVLDFVFPTQEALDTTFTPSTPVAPAEDEASTRRVQAANRSWNSARSSETSATLTDVPRILKAIDDRQTGSSQGAWQHGIRGSAHRDQRLIAGIWEQLLAVGSGGNPRGLLRTRRPLAAGDAGHFASVRHLPRQSAVAARVRRADRCRLAEVIESAKEADAGCGDAADSAGSAAS